MSGADLDEVKKPRVYILKSRCEICGDVSRIEYISGTENHECKRKHKWSKSPTSTTAAIMGIIAGDKQ
jgi:hypothetical protein